jgi:tripartite-type tricarboxylate transporter receptor subunit TctC
MRRLLVFLLVFLLVLFPVLAAGAAQAQPFAKPVRIFVGAPPGGTTDTLARAIAPEMSKALGVPVVVENRGGAGGNLAAEAVAKSPPDGQTLLVAFTSHTINATLYPKLPFDPVEDFTPITMIATVPSLLVGNPALPPKDLKELLAYAKARPGKLNFAIGGIGSSLHMAGDLLKMQTGVFVVNIPYKGTGPALADVIGGQVELMFVSAVVGLPQVKAGKLRAYGVTSAKRLPQLPDVPAIAEVVPGFESNAWFGLFGPARLPADITKTLNEAAVRAIRSPELTKRLEAEAAQPVGNPPSEFARFVREDVKRWAPVVKFSGAKPE